MAATMHAAAASVNLRVPNAGARQLRRTRNTVARVRLVRSLRDLNLEIISYTRRGVFGAE